MSDRIAKDEWVRRVFGIEPRQSKPAYKKALPIWQEARDLVGEQIGTLQVALRGSGLPLYERIADQGLNGLTQKHLVGMQVALMELDSATGETRAGAAAKVRSAAQSMRQFVNGPIPRLIERNRLGVAVTLTSSLGGALDKIEQMLE